MLLVVICLMISIRLSSMPCWAKGRFVVCGEDDMPFHWLTLSTQLSSVLSHSSSQSPTPKRMRQRKTPQTNTERMLIYLQGQGQADTYKDRRQSLVVSQDHPWHRSRRHHVPEARSASSSNLLRIYFRGILLQLRQQGILKGRLPERYEHRGSEILRENDKGCADGELVLWEVGLDRCYGLLRHHTSCNAIEQLVTNPCCNW